MQNQRRDFLPPSPPRRPHSLPSPGRRQGANIWASQIGTHLLEASSGGGGAGAGAGRPLGSTRHSHLLSFQARMPASGRCCCSSVPPPPCHPSPAACPRNTRSGHRRGEAGGTLVPPRRRLRGGRRGGREVLPAAWLRSSKPRFSPSLRGLVRSRSPSAGR